MSLDRFHQTQASRWSGYESALAEMRGGKKRSHWIWYIFPQIAGLGRSPAAQEFALQDLTEACDYLRDPVLRARYAEIAGAVHEQLTAGKSVDRLMGGATDALKLASSLTLFRAAVQHLVQQDASFGGLVELCDSLLKQTTAQGYPPCAFTLERLGSPPPG